MQKNTIFTETDIGALIKSVIQPRKYNVNMRNLLDNEKSMPILLTERTGKI